MADTPDKRRMFQRPVQHIPEDAPLPPHIVEQIRKVNEDYDRFEAVREHRDELLEALKDLVAELDDEYGTEDGDDPTMDQARQAIKAADTVIAQGKQEITALPESDKIRTLEAREEKLVKISLEYEGTLKQMASQIGAASDMAKESLERGQKIMDGKS